MENSICTTSYRTLSTFIPSQKIVRPFVDVVFKSVGFLSSLQYNDNDITAVMRPIGLSSNIPLCLGTLFCENKSFGLQGITPDGLPSLIVNYSVGKVLRLLISLEPTVAYGVRSGEWAIALVPVKNIADRESLRKVIPNFEDSKNIPGAVFGSAEKTLTFEWVPSINDSFAALDHSVIDHEPFAHLMCAYSQESRVKYTRFSPKVFGARIAIKATAQFSNRFPISRFSGASQFRLFAQGLAPKSIYVGTYLEKNFQFDESHIIDNDDCLEVRVTRSDSKLFNSLIQALD